MSMDYGIIKAQGGGQDNSSMSKRVLQMKKPTLAKFNGTLPAKMLAALCLLNCVGAVTPPETHPSVTPVKTGEGVAYAPWWMPTLMGADPSGIFTTKASLQTAVEAYNANPTTATKTYGPIAGWDVSMITDMSWLFAHLRNFNADISSWDTSKVTNMYGMFEYAYAFNQPWSLDTSNVTNMGMMFARARGFEQPLSFDTSKVTNMFRMFFHAAFYNHPLSFDTSKVTNMNGMFDNARAFNQPLSFDTSKVTNMFEMFQAANAFNQPLSFDTSKVTTMWWMFRWAYAFNQPLSFDISEVTTTRDMFYDTRSLSTANKLSIRCAWAYNTEFTSRYGSSWAPGICQSLCSAPGICSGLVPGSG